MCVCVCVNEGPERRQRRRPRFEPVSTSSLYVLCVPPSLVFAAAVSSFLYSLPPTSPLRILYSIHHSLQSPLFLNGSQPRFQLPYLMDSQARTHKHTLIHILYYSLLLSPPPCFTHLYAHFNSVYTIDIV